MPNTHLADATLRLDGEDRAPSSDDVARAAAEGTLALAYEQRTANLIAFLTLAASEGWAHDADGRTMRTMITEALDLATLSELIDGTYKVRAEKVDAGLAVIDAINLERGRIMSELNVIAHEGVVGAPLDHLAKIVFFKDRDSGA